MRTKLIHLLTENTNNGGTWYIIYNEHKGIYEPPETFYDKDDLIDCDITKPIYRLQWYKNTPIGFFSHCFNSLEEMEEYVEQIIKENNEN